MLFWEDDYLMIEIMSSNNIDFAKNEIGLITKSSEINQIETKKLDISKNELAEILKKIGLNKYKKILYAGIGEPQILDNPNILAFGSLETAIFFE